MGYCLKRTRSQGGGMAFQGQIMRQGETCGHGYRGKCVRCEP